MGKKKSKLFRICILLASLFLLICNPISVSAETDNEDLYIKPTKKVLSIVYDDSGSMYDDNDSWAQANYAIQVLASLMDTEDELYITYMSDVGTLQEGADEINLSDIDTAVSTIRNKAGAGGTPMKAVQIAMDQLTAVQTDEEDVQYWLIVLTDGSMDNVDTNYLDLQEMLDDFKGTVMQNGSILNLAYLGIGNFAVQIQGDTDAGFSSTNTGTDIVSALGDMANVVSGRCVFDSSQISVVDDCTVKVHTDLPLYSISVLTQKSVASVVSVKGEETLALDRNVSLKYPDSASYLNAETTKTLFGNAAQASADSGLIAPGDYTITFSEKVDLNDAVLMYQPAIGLQVTILKDGSEIDVDSLSSGEEVDIVLDPVNPQTGEVIADELLPDDIEWNITYEVDGTEVSGSDSREAKSVIIQSGESKIISSMTVEDFAPQISTITFDAGLSNVSILVEDSGDAAYYRNKLGKAHCLGTPLKFFITSDGQKLSKDEIPDNLRLEVQGYVLEQDTSEGNRIWRFIKNGGLHDVSSEIALNDDGSFEVYPDSVGVFCFLMRAGDYTVTVGFENDDTITAEGTYTVIGRLVDWVYAVIDLLILFLLIYILYILFLKPKFDNQIVEVRVYTLSARGNKGVENLPMKKTRTFHKFPGMRVLLPGPSYETIYGIRFRAGGSSIIEIKKSVIEKYERYGTSTFNPVSDYFALLKGLKSTGGGGAIPDMHTLVCHHTFYLYKDGMLYGVTWK